MKVAESTVIDIVSAEYIEAYELDIAFSNGEKRQVDFSSFLNSSQHPSIKKYLDTNLFQQFQIIDGNLNWNDYDMIFRVWDLYTGDV